LTKPQKTPRTLAHKAKVLERTAKRLPDLKAVQRFMQTDAAAGCEGLAELRTALGLTQEQAAELLHRTERNIRQFENGTRKMEPALVELLLFKALLLTQKKIAASGGKVGK